MPIKCLDRLSLPPPQALNHYFHWFQTLLDLSASPNYKDLHGLTPLYLCVANNTSAQCAEILLHDHAVVGITDERGWAEAHHVSFLHSSLSLIAETADLLAVFIHGGLTKQDT